MKNNKTPDTGLSGISANCGNCKNFEPKGKYDEKTMIAIEESKEIGRFFAEKGYDFHPGRIAFGNEVFGTCVVTGKSTMGIAFIISIFPEKPYGERYGFKYETGHCDHYDFQGKQQKIFEKLGISFFQRRGRNRNIGKIIFEIHDPKNEVLDIINKTKEIMGF